MHRPNSYQRVPLTPSNSITMNVVQSQPQASVSRQSEAIGPFPGTSSENATSPLPSAVPLLNGLKPGPVRSLFHGITGKRMPIGSALDVRYILPSCHPLKGSCGVYHPTRTADRTERETMCDSDRRSTQGSLGDAQDVSSFLREQELDCLKHRLVREGTNNGRVGNPFLSEMIRKIEEATASHHTDNSACIAPLGTFLMDLIRNFSPQYSPAEVVPYIIHWVELQTQNNSQRTIGSSKKRGPWNGRVESKKVDRMNIFSPLRMILMQRITDIWEPSTKKSGKRFLTCLEYREVICRLLLALPVHDKTADLLLRTVKGIDALKLFALVLDHECVAGEDVGLIGMSLAKDCVHDGYSFALYELYEAASDKLCRIRAEKYAYEAVDVAATVLKHNKFKFEDLEFFVQTWDLVKRYQRTQQEKWKEGGPKDGRPDRRSPREEVLEKEDVIPLLAKYGSLLNVH